MRSLKLAAIAGMALLTIGPVAAQTPEPEKAPAPTAQEIQPAAPVAPAKDAAAPEAPAPARFSFNRVDGGFLRLDGATGQVALCSQRDAGWTCQVVPEDRAALDSEIARLQGEVVRLKSEIAALRAPPGPPRPPADLAPRGEGDSKSGALKLPTDDDIRWARAAIERLWRHFVDMVADFQKDMQRKG